MSLGSKHPAFKASGFSQFSSFPYFRANAGAYILLSQSTTCPDTDFSFFHQFHSK